MYHSCSYQSKQMARWSDLMHTYQGFPHPQRGRLHISLQSLVKLVLLGIWQHQLQRPWFTSRRHKPHARPRFANHPQPQIRQAPRRPRAFGLGARAAAEKRNRELEWGMHRRSNPLAATPHAQATVHNAMPRCERGSCGWPRAGSRAGPQVPAVAVARAPAVCLSGGGPQAMAVRPGPWIHAMRPRVLSARAA